MIMDRENSTLTENVKDLLRCVEWVNLADSTLAGDVKDLTRVAAEISMSAQCRRRALGLEGDLLE